MKHNTISICGGKDTLVFSSKLHALCWYKVHITKQKIISHESSVKTICLIITYILHASLQFRGYAWLLHIYYMHSCSSGTQRQPKRCSSRRNSMILQWSWRRFTRFSSFWACWCGSWCISRGRSWCRSWHWSRIRCRTWSYRSRFPCASLQSIYFLWDTSAGKASCSHQASVAWKREVPSQCLERCTHYFQGSWIFCDGPLYESSKFCRLVIEESAWLGEVHLPLVKEKNNM